MKSQDIIELSRDALLVVSASRVTEANAAAISLFEACGRWEPLIGASLDELWEAANVGETPGLTLVRVRISMGMGELLQVVESPARGASAEYALRLSRSAGPDQPLTHEEAADRLRQLMNAIQDAVLIVDCGTLGFQLVNDTAARLFGMSTQDMLRAGPIGTRAMGLRTDDDLRALCQRTIERHPRAVTATHAFTPPEGPHLLVEYEHTAVWLDGRWLIVTVGRDVTQRMATQRRLEQLRAAVNEASDMVLVINPETLEYIEINESTARQHGLTREVMMERGLKWVIQYTKMWTPEQLRKRFAEVIERHPGSINDLHTMAIDGQPEKIIESTRRAVRVDGQWLIISVARDVTARVRAEQELHLRMDELSRSNRDLEQFAYVTSHDLSEPLRMVASYTQLLARRYTVMLDDDGREFMGHVVGGAQRMKRLIDDLLAYSRAGREGAVLHEIPLDQPLDEALANLAKAIRDTEVRIERPAVLPSLLCSRIGMVQLFQNLIGNALKFKGESPLVIRVESARGGQDVTVSVTDNGIGIEPRYFERIFVIFQRLHAQGTYEGTGIGLAICKKIVEQHGGSLWVESAPGQGASFKFRLPARRAAQPGAPASGSGNH